MEQQHLKVVWRSVGMRPGALCVMGTGQDLMLKWLVDSWDTQQLVWYCHETANCHTLVIIFVLFSICACLGYTYYHNAYFGQGFGPILLDDLLCTGRETRIIDCPRSTSTGVGDIDSCRGHLDDAGLRCVEGTSK